MNVRPVVAAVLVLALASSGAVGMRAQDAPTRDARRPQGPVVGRSVVATTYGIVAASQPLAARAGVQILERGGNAIDAAIAANATIGLMEPTGNGIGGDLFILYYEAKTGTRARPQLQRLGAVRPHRRSPRVEGPQDDAAARHLLGDGAGRRRRMGRDAHRSSARKPFSELLAPAIYYAENGFPLSENIAGGWASSVKMHSEHPELAQDVPDRRRARAESRRGVPQSRPCRVAAPDRGAAVATATTKARPPKPS